MTRIELGHREVIEDLLNHGTSIKDISNVTKISTSAIYQEIKRSGGIRLYNAKDAQNNYEERMKKLGENRNSPIQHLRNRVKKLEEELEQIKCLLKNREKR